MNSRFTLFFISMIIFSLSVQKMNAQEKNKLLNENILKEIKNIQKRFSDSINHYSYKEDPALYAEKFRSFYGEKIIHLKNLYQNIYDKDLMIGKIDPGIVFKTGKEMQIENGTSQVESASQNGIKNKSIDIAEVENYKQLEDLQKRLTTGFPTYLLEDGNEGVYRCILTFMIDIDGKFKNIKYNGTSNMEFNIISALFLYAIGTLEKPLLYNKIPIVQQFSQPIVLRFE